MILLVRHGESIWNAEHRWQGQADPPLSSRGEEQARRAAATVADLGPFTLVAASPLRRARRTAELLCPVVPEPLPLPGLMERAAGAWTGLTHAEIDRRWPGARVGTWRPRDYETEDGLRSRVHAALLDLPTGNLLVVTHEGVIRALDGDPAPLPNLGARRFERTGDRVEPVGARLSLAA